MIANAAHLPAWKHIHEDAEVVAVADIEEWRAQESAKRYDVPLAYGDWRRMLAEVKPDIVSVATPNMYHKEITIAALKGGAHVLCEKPIALTLAEVDAMTQAAQESGKVLAEAFMYRHHPQTLKVKEIVDSGALGKLQLIKGAFTFTLTREGDIRLNKEMGGGSIWDVGCYPISYARTLAGAEALEVFGWQVAAQSGIDESFYGQIKFENGVYAQFDSGFKSPFRSRVEIVGTDGVLTVPDPFKPERTSEILLARGDKTEKIKIKGGMLYMGEVDDMCDAILHNKPPRVSLADSRSNVAVILALLESARSGKPARVAGERKS